MAAPASLANRILLGLIAGAAAGALTLLLGNWFPGLLSGARWVSTTLLDPFGQVFLRLLFFVIVPLVFASLAAGVVQLGSLSRLGPLAGRTFFLFAANMVIGVALGLVMMHLLQPGRALDPETQARLIQEYSGATEKAVATRQGQQAVDLAGVSIW